LLTAPFSLKLDRVSIWLRDAGQKEELKEAMLEDFIWERPSRTPRDIELYLLAQGDTAADILTKRPKE
jgi:hypothetical protein